MDLGTGEELPWDGEKFGEVQVRGPWIASGYHRGADAERITPDGWLRTGDVANVSADGYVTLVDRVKDVIKSGGEWVSSVDLENTIMGHPQVAEAAVIGLSHPTWQERPVAYVVARGDLSEKDALDFLSTRVAKWWLPNEVRFVAEIPKTSVGKSTRKRCARRRRRWRPLHRRSKSASRGAVAAPEHVLSVGAGGGGAGDGPESRGRWSTWAHGSGRLLLIELRWRRGDCAG